MKQCLNRDLASPAWLYMKAAGFLMVGFAAAALILLQTPRWDVGLYLAICVWAFARAYYFAFYVVEHFIDPGFKYAGLIHFCRYLIQKKKQTETGISREE